MTRLDGTSDLDGLSLLHQQLRQLVVALTVASGPIDVQPSLRRLAGTAISLERPLEAGDPMILDYLRVAFAHAAQGRTDELRGDLLDASRHLFALLKAGAADSREVIEGVMVPEGDSAFRRWRS